MRLILILSLTVIFIPIFAQDTTNESDKSQNTQSSDVDLVVQILAPIATVAGILTAAKGVLEYSSENRRKRSEQFIEMRKRFKENKKQMEICDLLEHDEEKLKEISYNDKKYFLGFYEEVALMMNSKLIKKEIAHYMFAYYAIKCLNSVNFWATGPDKKSVYWTTFIKFAQTMQTVELNFDPTKEFKL